MAFRFFRKKYKMDPAVAEKMFHEILSACDVQDRIRENTIKQMQQKHREATRRYRVMISLSALAISALLVTPFLFPASPARVSTASTTRDLQIVEHKEQAGVFTLTVGGDNINEDTIRILRSDGSELPILSLSYDLFNTTIQFPFEQEELNIYIETTDGGSLHLLLTPR